MDIVEIIEELKAGVLYGIGDHDREQFVEDLDGSICTGMVLKKEDGLYRVVVKEWEPGIDMAFVIDTRGDYLEIIDEYEY